MKTLAFLIALLYICSTVSYVSAQVGNQKLHLLVEYFLPYWRQHRARLRPYAFAQPVPVWRVAKRSAASDEETNWGEIDVKQRDQDQRRPQAPSEYVGCIYYRSRLLCERILNDERTFQAVECQVKKRFLNPVLDNFVSFSISDKRENDTTVRFNLFPKKPVNMRIDPVELKSSNQLSLHWLDAQSDEGFQFEDRQCWLRLQDLLERIEPTAVNVRKVNSKTNKEMRASENIIGNLISIDFDL